MYKHILVPTDGSAEPARAAKAAGVALTALIVGSVTQKVLSHSKIPVLVFR